MKTYHYLFLFVILLASCTVQEQEELTPREALVVQVQQSVENYDVTWSYVRINETKEYISDSTRHVQVVEGEVSLYEEKGTVEPYCNKTYTKGATSWISCDCVPSTTVFRRNPCGVGSLETGRGEIFLTLGGAPISSFNRDLDLKDQILDIIVTGERVGTVAIASFETTFDRTCYLSTSIRNEEDYAPNEITGDITGSILPFSERSNANIYCFNAEGLLVNSLSLQEQGFEGTYLQGDYILGYPVDKKTKEIAQQILALMDEANYTESKEKTEQEKREEQIWEDLYHDFRDEYYEPGDEIYRLQEALVESSLDQTGEEYQAINNKIQALLEEFNQKEEYYDQQSDQIELFIFLYQHEEAQALLETLQQDLEIYEEYVEEQTELLRDEITTASFSDERSDEEKKEELEERIEGINDVLDEINTEATSLSELLENSPLQKESEEYQEFSEEIGELLAEVDEKETEYQSQIETIEALISSGNYQGAASLLSELQEEVEEYFSELDEDADRIDSELAEISFCASFPEEC